MRIISIRRVTNDARHNAFTGACWFKGNLFVAYRQGDAHACAFGRLVVLRSRDRGISWDHVAVLRGSGDTRDAHLYTDGERLYAVGFCIPAGGGHTSASGCASTLDGDGWTSYEGTGEFVLWRPQVHRGKHYCAGYDYARDPKTGKKKRGVYWFESADGRRWTRVRKIYTGPDQANECYLEILRNGRAAMLMRCEGGGRHPYLCQSKYPFAKWTKRKLTDISIGGPCLWTVGRDIYIGARWRCVEPRGHRFAHTAIFKVVGGRTQLQCVLPSGPGFDHSYMASARYPDNPRRFAISFYSDAVAPCDPRVEQWTHPDIYWADVSFEEH